eukprot:Nitzschia sp. Nitz4//scaffold4_size323378//59131//59379//NITZ4_000628-RA/size323378-processed-gene-0.264-mRNA-1//1//CDS//3329553303//2789//frame0
MIDLEASPIAGQTGWAVLDLQGELVKSSEFLEQDRTLLLQLLQQGASVATEDFQRLTITFSSSRFVVTRDKTHIYMVQTRVG